jgi:hypothetical protein
MKFSSTVDSLSRENRFLRRVIGLLALGVTVLALVITLLYDKPEKIVLRSSHGLEIVALTPLTRTEADVEQAVRLMVKARLESDAIAPEVFLSKQQMALRGAEQRELKSRGFTQSIVVRSAQIQTSSAIVNFDRVISVGDIRSAIQTKANIAFEEIEPNDLNPYGLRLSMLSPIEPETPGANSPTKRGSK